MITSDRTKRTGLAITVVLGIAGLAGAVAQANRGLPEGRQPANINPADFTTRIDNPYYPLRPGDRRVYRETAPDGSRQKIVDVVTNRTKLIANGVTARVIVATVTNQRGKVVEFTEEWFAQDRAGNVWYFGEDTTAYEHGRPNKHGSFEAGARGEADVMIAGGAEAPLAPLCFGAFAIIRAMSTRNDDPSTASRPFDADRDGFVMAEGSAVLILEERGRALARGAPVYAEVCGYGLTNDAYHMTAPRPDGSQAARCIRNALAEARVAPSGGRLRQRPRVFDPAQRSDGDLLHQAGLRRSTPTGSP